MTHHTKNPKSASTVILTREYSGELQVYLLRRSDKSSFMPGQYVFPGGTVESLDKEQKYGFLILEPWDPMIDRDVLPDPQELEEAILPVGEPFSRIWNHNGLWRPVRI